MMPSFHNIPKVNKCDVIYTLIIYRHTRINERIYHLLRYVYKENTSKLHSSFYALCQEEWWRIGVYR